MEGGGGWGGASFGLQCRVATIPHRGGGGRGGLLLGRTGPTTREDRSVEGGGGWGGASFGLQCRVAIGTIIADPFFGYFTAGRGARGYDTTPWRWGGGRTTTREDRSVEGGGGWDRGGGGGEDYY